MSNYYNPSTEQFDLAAMRRDLERQLEFSQPLLGDIIPDLPKNNLLNAKIKPLGQNTGDKSLINAKAKRSIPQFGKHTDFTKVNMDQIISGVNMASNILDNSADQQLKSLFGSSIIDLGKVIGGNAGKGLQTTGTAINIANFADSVTNAAFGGGSKTDEKDFRSKVPLVKF